MARNGQPANTPAVRKGMLFGDVARKHPWGIASDLRDATGRHPLRYRLRSLVSRRLACGRSARRRIRISIRWLIRPIRPSDRGAIPDGTQHLESAYAAREDIARMDRAPHTPWRFHTARFRCR